MERLCQVCVAFSVFRFLATAMRCVAFSEVDRMLSPSLQPFSPLFFCNLKTMLLSLSVGQKTATLIRGS